MAVIEAKLESLGLVLPAATVAPRGGEFLFDWVRVRGHHVYVSGHSPHHPDGTFAGPFGKVPSEVSFTAATDAARATVLAVLASVKREIGDLDRISAWLSVSGMVNADGGYPRTTNTINGFSELVLELFGPDVGAHARTAVGFTALPLNNAVVVAAELEIDGPV